MTDFFKNLLAYPAALAFVLKNGLTKYFLISGFISLAIGALAFGGIYAFSDDLGGLLVGLYPFDWGQAVVAKAANIIMGTLLSVIALVAYKYLLLIFIGPFMGPLAEEIEEIETGRAPLKQGLGQMGYAMIRGIRLASRNIFKELLYTLLIVIAGLIPLLSPFSAVGVFAIQAYYVGFANVDYHLEKRNTIRQSVSYGKSNKWALIGNGTGFLLLLFIPIIGLLMAPVLGTVVATRDAISKGY